MWSRIGDINKIDKRNSTRTEVEYFPYLHNCPITHFAFQQFRNGEIELFIYFARLPGLEDLMEQLRVAERTLKDAEFQEPSLYGAVFYLEKMNQHKIDWFLQLLDDINSKFAKPFFDSTIINEVTQVVHWLQRNDMTQPPYLHLVDEMANGADPYVNPDLQESKTVLYVSENFTIQNLSAARAIIQRRLAAGENPNQHRYYHNPLNRLICRSIDFQKNLTNDEREQLETFLADLTVVFICYGLDVFNRHNPCRYATIDFVVGSSFQSVYDVILKSMSKPQRPQLIFEQKTIVHTLDDKIYLELSFPKMNIRSCIMPVGYLQPNEIISLFSIFAETFRTADDSNLEKLRAIFCNDFQPEKMIEIFYHRDRIIGLNLTYFSIDHKRKQITYHIDYFLFIREYQQLGLASFIVPILALALQLYLSHSPKWEDYNVVVQCESVSEASHRAFQYLLYFPKYKTPEISRDAKTFIFKIFDGNCRYVETDTTCFIDDEVELNATPSKKRKLSIFDDFYNLMRGLSRDQSTPSNRSVPIRFLVAKKYYEQWINQAKKLGEENPEAFLQAYATLLSKRKWFPFTSKQTATIFNCHQAFQYNDTFLFFKNKRIRIIEQNKPSISSSSRL